MEKKAYIAPKSTAFAVKLQQMIADSGKDVHTDDPQNPGNSMSRVIDWEDDEEEY